MLGAHRGWTQGRPQGILAGSLEGFLRVVEGRGLSPKLESSWAREAGNPDRGHGGDDGVGGGRAQPGRQVGHGKLPREAGKILRSKCSQGPILSQVWWWGGEADGQGP